MKDSPRLLISYNPKSNSWLRELDILSQQFMTAAINRNRKEMLRLHDLIRDHEVKEIKE